MKYNFLKTLTVVFSFFALTSCDKDYLTIGGDIIGKENFNFLPGEDANVVVYDQNIESVQTNNLSINQLGVIRNGKLGKTTAGFVTQLSLTELSPTINSGVVVDSVVLTVPYFSTKLLTESSGRNTYRLDSIYKSKNDVNKISLKVFRSGYYLNDLDVTDPSKPSKYYSDQQNNIASNVEGVYLNDDANLKENLEFEVVNKEFVEYKVDATTLQMLPKTDVTNIKARVSPRIRLKLNTDHFKNAILNAPSDKLASLSAFKEYYRGLYFEATDINQGELLMNLDFSKGDVTIYYKQDSVDDDATSKKERKTLVLNMSGNSINLLKNEENTDYVQALNDKNEIAGDQKLFLKGGQGSVVFLKLDDAKINELKSQNILLNDASVYFKVDNSSLIDDSRHPLRLYLFDTENNRSILDYSTDVTLNAANPKKSKYIHDGILQKDVNGNRFYRIRLTDHLNRIIKDKTGTYKNVKLGLVITENIGFAPEIIGTTANRVVRGVSPNLNFYPLGAVVNPLGTILYGNSNDENRVRFKISYTKPN